MKYNVWKFIFCCKTTVIYNVSHDKRQSENELLFPIPDLKLKPKSGDNNTSSEASQSYWETSPDMLRCYLLQLQLKKKKEEKKQEPGPIIFTVTFPLYLRIDWRLCFRLLCLQYSFAGLGLVVYLPFCSLGRIIANCSSENHKQPLICICSL